jgi:hypothetical protein
VHPDEHVVERCVPPLAAKRALKPHGRGHAQSDQAVADDRIAHPDSPLERLAAIVGKLVDDDERPHLEDVNGDVALPRSGRRDR